MLHIKYKGNHINHRPAMPRFKFKKECKVTALLNDLFVAFFFVSGSLFNFADAEAVYGNALYLFGSLILAGRAVHNVKANLSVVPAADTSDNSQTDYGNWK